MIVSSTDLDRNISTDLDSASKGRARRRVRKKNRQKNVIALTVKDGNEIPIDAVKKDIIVVEFYMPIKVTFTKTMQRTVTVKKKTMQRTVTVKKIREAVASVDSDDDAQSLIAATCSFAERNDTAKEYFDPLALEKPLPEGVHDIDVYDADDAQCCLEYVGFIMEALRKKQARIMALKRAAPAPTRLHFAEKNRAMLVDWLAVVVVKFKLLSESFFTCVELIDICLRLPDVLLAIEQFQLLGICCLMISCKAEEIYPPPTLDYACVCDRAFTKAQILHGERIILNATKFEVFPPTSLSFLRRFSKAARSSTTTHTMSKYICENACTDYGICQLYLPSEIAIGAVVAARATCDPDGVLLDITLQHYSQHSRSTALRVAVALVLHLEKNWCLTHALKAVKRKYSTATLLYVGRKDITHVLPRLRAELKQSE